MSDLKLFKIRKASGEMVHFSEKKLRNSLFHSGASKDEIDQVLQHVLQHVYDGIRSKEVYKMAYRKLKSFKTLYASRYKLKKAIYQMGPSGFPFEHLIAKLFHHEAYETSVGEIIKGKCVKHEVDVLLKKEQNYALVECKFHSDDAYICNIRIPLYIHSRYHDLKKGWPKPGRLRELWIVTNTRFSSDAIDYAECNGIKLLSWNYPENKGLKYLMSKYSFYPITVISLLSAREKELLLSRHIILCRDIIEYPHVLDKVGIDQTRKKRILKEIEELCY